MFTNLPQLAFAFRTLLLGSPAAGRLAGWAKAVKLPYLAAPYRLLPLIADKN